MIWTDDVTLPSGAICSAHYRNGKLERVSVRNSEAEDDSDEVAALLLYGAYNVQYTVEVGEADSEIVLFLDHAIGGVRKTRRPRQ